MKLKALILVALTAINASPAFAGEWWLVGNRGEMSGQAPNRKVYFVDRASITREGSKLLAWTAFVEETTGSNGRKIIMFYQRFDCGFRKFVSLKYRVLSDDEKLIDEIDVPLSAQTEKVVPHSSPANGVLKLVCGVSDGNPEKLPGDIDIGTFAEMMFSGD